MTTLYCFDNGFVSRRFNDTRLFTFSTEFIFVKYGGLNIVYEGVQINVEIVEERILDEDSFKIEQEIQNRSLNRFPWLAQFSMGTFTPIVKRRFFSI